MKDKCSTPSRSFERASLRRIIDFFYVEAGERTNIRVKRGVHGEGASRVDLFVRGQFIRHIPQRSTDEGLREL